MKRIEFETKHKTSYCIPEWLRDEQIRFNTSIVADRVEPVDGKDFEPCAVVCFGPSLQDTWQQVRDFRVIFTCSGAHKFLLERGIEPDGRLWHHVEVDPRQHKIELLGQPRQGIRYFPSSTCHPEYLRHLDGHDVRLWHPFQEYGGLAVPRGEWLLTGGSNVGLRAMVIARFMGYVNQHVFGMDGCKRDGFHADRHPNSPKGEYVTTYKGRDYVVTPSLLECAKEITHEMDMLPDVEAKFYGDGLVQEIMKDYKRGEKKEVMIALQSAPLISDEYRDLNRRLHRENAAYGVSGAKHAHVVLKLAESMNTTSILDYGCGKGYLGKNLPFPIWEYDPCIAGKDETPRPAEIVVCGDVLEHIEPEMLDAVLSDLRRVVKNIGYFIIHTGPAQKVLADGRNAHLIQQGEQWWTSKLSNYLKVASVKTLGNELHYVVAKSGKPNKVEG